MENTNTATVTETRTITDFLTQYPITVELQEVPENPTMEDSREKMINYFVMLKFEGRLMSLYFSTSLGWVETRKGEPTSMITYHKPSGDFIKTEWGGKRYNANDGSMFPRYRVKKPTVADILDCLASDASGDGQSFDDWASDFGYDTDSRKAEETYRTIQKQTKELRQLIGRDAFADLVYNTERM